MADIRCPMCSKLNPDHLDICQYCQARLKPLVGPAQGGDADLPDWLRSLGNDLPGDEPDQPLDDSQDALDWLDRLGGEPAEKPGLDTKVQPPAQPAQETEPPFVEEDGADWLSDFRDLGVADDDGEFPEENEASDQVGQVPDWMHATGLAPVDAEGNGVPDWLENFGERPEPRPESEAYTPDFVDFAEESDSKAGRELPDWLAADRAEQAQELASDTDREFPDWFATDEKDADDLDDWLAETAPQPPQAEPLATGELPDWLASLDKNISPPAETAPADADVDFSDWLVEPDPATSPADEPDVFPDWLSDLGGAPLSEQQQPTPADPGGLPAWLGAEEDQDAVIFESEMEGAETAAEVSMPDWLLGMEGFAVPEESSALDYASDGAEFGEQDSRAVPAWLRHEDPAAPPAFLADDDFEQELPATRGSAPFVDDGEFGDDLMDSDQLPDWISDTEEQQMVEPAAGLAQADLPSWVQAMRPVDTSSAKPEERGPVEMAGPLAGLHNVLSAEPEIARLKKPPAYSIKLKFTDAQQTRSAIFDELMETEGRPQPIPRPPLISSQRVLRAIIGAVMLVLIGLVVFSGTQVTPMPKVINIPREVSQASMLVERLGSDARVLMAFEYEPGLSGEMNVTAASVVNHLMLKGSRLTLISTSPTGPALAEYFIGTVQAQHNYQSGLQYVNLGYLPGGISGLLTFAEIPRQVTKFSFDGLAAWETEPLQGIERLSDFDMLVLVTDNPNTARAWIEQVEPKLGQTPLIAVISAQAEPLVRPYYGGQDAQVDGMVSGVVGGAFYEQATGPSLARTYWDAFNLGLVLAVAAILIGGLLQLISLLLARRAEKQGEAA